MFFKVGLHVEQIIKYISILSTSPNTIFDSNTYSVCISKTLWCTVSSFYVFNKLKKRNSYNPRASYLYISFRSRIIALDCSIIPSSKLSCLTKVLQLYSRLRKKVYKTPDSVHFCNSWLTFYGINQPLFDLNWNKFVSTFMWTFNTEKVICLTCVWNNTQFYN